MLTFVLLGSPHIFIDGTEVTGFNTRKDLGLVIFLAESGASHSREELAGLLWSDMPEDNARRNLRNSLSNLRKLLGPQWLSGTRRLAWANPEDWDSDTRQLQATVQRLRQWTPQPDRPASARSLQTLNHALTVYRGEFLQGLYLLKAALFEEWLFQKREEYRLLALQGLELLAARALAEEYYLEGLQATRRMLSLEPWSEVGHILRMKLLAGNGQRAAALIQYENCRAILAQELGIEPMAETTALYEQIRSGGYGQKSVKRLPPAPANRVPTWTHPATQPPTRPTIAHNLPAAVVPLIGYREELAYVQSRLLGEECRLLSITGMGGAGKTHLSLEVGRQIHRNGAATRFRDGVYFVPLEANPESQDREKAADSITSAIAGVLGFALKGERSRQEQVQSYLAHKEMLLILDNMEHLLAGSWVISRFLRQAPGLSILATSRASLALQGEGIVELWGLNPEETLGEGAGSSPAPNDAANLFIYQAKLLDRHFDPTEEEGRQIRRICQLVGGLPLGIEIAARWLGLLSLQAIETKLSTSFDLLHGNRRDIPDRHHTLRAVFDHSWSLLSIHQQQLLASLGVFQPTFPVAAAQAIVGATPSALDELVRRSLLRRAGETKLALHPAIHQFAKENLEALGNRRQEIWERYVAYYLNLAADSAKVLFTSAWAEAKEPLYEDLDNFKVAIRHAFQGNQWDVLNNAFETTRFTFDQLGWYWEGRDLCNWALERLAPPPPAKTNDAGWAKAILIGRLMTARAAFEGRLGLAFESMASFERALEYQRRVTAALEADGAETALISQARQVLGFGLSQFGILKNLVGQTQEAVGLLQEAQQLSTDEIVRPLAHYGLALAFFRLGEYGPARRNAQFGLDLARRGGDQRRITFLLSILGRIEQGAGHYTLAQRLYQESYTGVLALGDQTGIVQALKDLGDIARCLGDTRAAQAYLMQASEITLQKDFVVVHSEILWALGNLALEEGDYAQAHAYFQESRSRPETRGLTVEQLPILGWALMGLGDFVGAESYFSESLGIALRAHANRVVSEALGGLVVLLGVGGDKEASEAFLRAIIAAPATARETTERLRAMSGAFHIREKPGANRTYRISPSLRPLIENTLATTFPSPSMPIPRRERERERRGDATE